MSVRVEAQVSRAGHGDGGGYVAAGRVGLFSDVPEFGVRLQWLVVDGLAGCCGDELVVRFLGRCGEGRTSAGECSDEDRYGFHGGGKKN